MLKITYGGFDKKTAKKMSTQNRSFCAFSKIFCSFCAFSQIINTPPSPVRNTSIAHKVARKIRESSHKATNNCAFANFWQQTNCIFTNFWPLFFNSLHAAHFISNSFTSREVRIIIYM